MMADRSDSEPARADSGGIEPRSMPPHVRARVQRTMNWVAERLLEIESDSDPLGVPLPGASRVNGDATPGVDK